MIVQSPQEAKFLVDECIDLLDGKLDVKVQHISEDSRSHAAGIVNRILAGDVPRFVKEKYIIGDTCVNGGISILYQLRQSRSDDKSRGPEVVASCSQGRVQVDVAAAI